MKRVWILTLLALAAVSLNGCSSCGGGLFGNWFNRGSNCGPPPCAAHGPTMIGAGSPVIIGAPPEAGPIYPAPVN